MSNNITERPIHRPGAATRHSAPTRTRQTPKKTATRQRHSPPSKRKKAKAKNRIAFGKIFGHTFVRRFALSVIVALLLILCLMVFLRVQTISVVGNSLYTTAEIQEAAGISQGSALLLVNKTAVASHIKAQLPYIDEVRVGIGLPNTIKVEIVELATTYAVAANDGSYWLINSSGRLVEQITAKEAEEYLTIEGVRIENAKIGENLSVVPDAVNVPEDEEKSGEEAALDAPSEATSAQRMDTALQIVRQLEAVDDIRAITSIDVSSIYDLEIWYGTRFQVKLGDNSDLSYKLEYMVAALSQLESYQSGVLDLTFEEAKKATFIPWNSEKA